MRGCGSNFRGMEDGRRIKPDIAGIGQTSDGTAAPDNIANVILGNSSKFVRSGSDQERCIASWHRIDVGPQSHHFG